MYNYYDFEFDFLSTNDKLNTFNNCLEESFDVDRNNFQENSFGANANEIFGFSNNSEIMNQNSDIICQNISNIQNINPPKKFLTQKKIPKEELKKLLGRKRKGSNESRKHDKYSQDNIIRKVKAYFLNAIFNYINAELKELNILSVIKINGKTLKKEEIKLLKINQQKVKDISCEGNKKLLNEKLGEIFSEKISGSYTNYTSDFNSKLIKELYKIKNGKKITCILNMTFLDCLKYFRKDPIVIYDPQYSCLTGLIKDFEDIRTKLSTKNENDERYINEFIRIIKNFENIYYKKKERARRNKKELNN